MSKTSSKEIDDLFRREISREINRVVKVEDENKETVQRELEEYILTPLLEKHFLEVLETLVDSEHGIQDDPGIWISGFFGSGKSHFMKILGHVLEDEEFGGHSASDIFKRRTADETLKATVDSVNSKFDSEVLMFQIGAHEDKSAEGGGEDISQIVLRQFNKELGLSGTPWIAEIERDLNRRGKYEEFKDTIKSDTGREWEEVRTEATFARKDIEKTLTKITDFDEEDARQSIEDVKDTVISPQSVTGKILNHVEDKEERTGDSVRYFVFLDEISQFIGEDKGQLLELQALVEEFSNQGGGKLWLGVTSQERLDALLPGVLANKKEEDKVSDRFPNRYDLTAQDLDQVVRERILQKKENVVPNLADFYRSQEGMINTRYKLDNSKNAGSIDEDKFVDCYPFLPYQLEVLPDIFSALRGTAGQSDLTGTERTLIDVTHSIFNPPHNLREEEVGSLVTLDMIFDEIKGEMKDKDVKTIEEASIKGIDNALARRTLKALYLIQQLSWIPNTSGNVATALYPEIGDMTSFENDVEDALEKMKGVYIGEGEDGYRFLSQNERDIEKEIASIDVKQGDIRRRSKKILSNDVFNNSGKVNHEGSTFEVSLDVDGEEISDDGEIELVAYSPVHQSYETVEEKKIKTASFSEEDRIYWIAESSGNSLIDNIEREYQIEYVINNKSNTKLSKEEKEAVDQKKEDLQRLKRSNREKLKKSFRQGSIIYNGEVRNLDASGTRIEKIVKRNAGDAIPHVFTKLDDGLANVRDKDIEVVFEDIESRSLPSVFEELSLVVGDEINPEAPICKEIEDEIDKRRKTGEDTSGKAILDHFGSSPYGWGRNVVRIGVAVLFRNGSLVPTYEEKKYSSYNENRAQDLFTSIRKFRKTSFEEVEGISPDKRKDARKLLKKLFDKNVDDTIKGVAQGIEEVSREWATDCANIQPELRRSSFPLLDDVSELEDHLNSLKAKKTNPDIIAKFLDIEDEIGPLIKAAKEVFNFERSGKLDDYKTYRDFLDAEWENYTDLAQDTDKIEIDEGLENTAENLERALDSEEVIENWSEVETDYGKLAQEYANSYEDLYEKRYEVYNEAIEEVRSYADGLGDEDIENALGSLRGRRGEDTIDIDVSEDEHIGKDPKIDRLSEHINTVGIYKQDAKDEIDDLRGKGETVTKYSISLGTVLQGIVVEDESDMEEALGALRDEIQTKLESEDDVEIRFK